MSYLYFQSFLLLLCITLNVKIKFLQNNFPFTENEGLKGANKNKKFSHLR